MDTKFVEQITNGKLIAMRITGGNINTLKFPISQTGKAIVPLMQACKPTKTDAPS